MITRRFFAGCAFCAAGLTATSARADAPSFKRTILNQIDQPGDQLRTLQVIVDIDPTYLVAAHTHPGVETAYILEGGGEFMIKGAANRKVGPGDTFQVPTETPHALQNGAKATKVLSIYVVDKSKPLASPASMV